MSYIPATERAKVTAPALRARKGGEPIVALTAYDYPSARLVDEAGVDVILVGDSVANVMLGYDSTIPVTLDEMMLVSRAVCRAVRNALSQRLSEAYRSLYDQLCTTYGISDSWVP